MARESRLVRLLSYCCANDGSAECGHRNWRFTFSQLTACFNQWLKLSWPWWTAIGVVGVTFLGELFLLESILALVILVLIYGCLRKTRPLSTAAVYVMVGVVWGMLNGQLTLNNTLPDSLVRQEVWASGTVLGLPQLRERALRFRFRVESLEHESGIYDHSGEVLLNWYKPFPELKAGQRWRLKLRLKPAHGSLNPGGFNYEQWLFSRGIRSTGYVREPSTAVLVQDAGFLHRVEHIRASIQAFIEAQALDNGGLINALAVGVRAGISDEQWRVFRDTGTAHLIAISGLHIGMVAGMVYFLVHLLWRYSLLARTYYPAQYVARLAAMLAALVYAALAVILWSLRAGRPAYQVACQA